MCGLHGRWLRHRLRLSIQCLTHIIAYYLFQVDIRAAGEGVRGCATSDGRPSTIRCIIGGIGRAIFGFLSTLFALGTLTFFCTTGSIAILAKVSFLVTVVAFCDSLRLVPLLSLDLMVRGLECRVFVPWLGVSSDVQLTFFV